MDRRTYLGYGVGLVASLAGCTADALPNSELMEEPTPNPECPAVGPLEQTICPPDDGPVSVTRSSKSVSGGSWSLVVGVINQTDQVLRLHAPAWSLFRRSPDGWTSVVPAAPVQESRALEPGDRYEWQLTADSEGLSDLSRRVYLDLAAGQYAFLIPVVHDRPVGAVAPFEVTR